MAPYGMPPLNEASATTSPPIPALEQADLHFWSAEEIIKRRGYEDPTVIANLAKLARTLAYHLGHTREDFPTFYFFVDRMMSAVCPPSNYDQHFIPKREPTKKEGLPLPRAIVSAQRLYEAVRPVYVKDYNEQERPGTATEREKKQIDDFIFGACADFCKMRFAGYVPEDLRYQGMWVVAPPGHGKSSFLSYLIERDFEKVARDQASVIVMESKRDLITSIQGLARFAPGGDLYGKLISLDLEQVESPLALNLFDFGDIDGLPPREQEITLNAVNGMFEYTFRTLLQTDMTPRLSTMFTALTQLVLKIPGGTIDTMKEICEPDGLQPYLQYVDLLDRDQRSFFKSKWNDRRDPATNMTKALIVDRIATIKGKVRVLGRMLSAKKLKVNFEELLATPKVILISYPKGMFQEEGTELLGRFFLAQIMMVTLRRQFLSKEQRTPLFIYCDEAQDVIRRDELIGRFLSQCRSLNIAMTFAHQRLDEDQLSPAVFRALCGTAAMVFAAKLDFNVDTLARVMHTTPEFITTAPTHVWAAYARGSLDNATSYRPPYVDFMRQPRMSEWELEAHQNEMRERFAITPDDEPEDPDDEPPESPPSTPQRRRQNKSEDLDY